MHIKRGNKVNTSKITIKTVIFNFNSNADKEYVMGLTLKHSSASPALW